jgi:hypothetical protein
MLYVTILGLATFYSLQARDKNHLNHKIQHWVGSHYITGIRAVRRPHKGTGRLQAACVSNWWGRVWYSLFVWTLQDTPWFRVSSTSLSQCRPGFQPVPSQGHEGYMALRQVTFQVLHFSCQHHSITAPISSGIQSLQWTASLTNKNLNLACSKP